MSPEVADWPQLAAVHDLLHPACERVVAVVEGLHDHDLLLLGGRRYEPRLRGVRGEGLLAEDVLALLDSCHRPLVVKRVGEWHVDRVDLGVRHDVLVRTDYPGDGVLVGERLGALAVPSRDGDD
jgi:hypothetical protein